MEFTDCQPPLFAATVMNAFTRPWCIAGGWAIDLWLNRATRDHGDVEIAILREDQIALRDFMTEAKFDIITSRGPVRWRDRQMLMLPVHQLRVHHQAHDLKILLDEHHRGQWVYRNDWRVKMPIDQWSARGAFGVPVIAPEISLLYKSANVSDRDNLDLRSAMEAMRPAQLLWLREALQLASPQHQWINEISRFLAQ